MFWCWWIFSHLLLIPPIFSLDSIVLEDVTIYFPLKVDYLGPFSCALNGSNCDDEGVAYIPAAMKVAVDRINKMANYEVFHNLSVNFVDITSNGPKAAATAALNASTIAVMGLSRDCYIESTILNINSKIGISDTCEMDLSSVTGFDQTTVLFNSASDTLANSVLYFLQKYEWKKVAIISPSNSLSSFNSKLRSNLLESLSSNNIDILLDSRIDQTATAASLYDQIAQESTKARIFIICDWSENANLLRNYFYTLGELNKIQSGEFFIISYIPYGVNAQWLQADSGDQRLLHFGNTEIGDFNLTENDLHTIYRNLLVLSDGPPPATANSTWLEIQKEIIQVAESTKFCPPYCKKNISTTVYPRWDRIKSMFDTFQYLADSTNESLSVGGNIYQSSVFYEHMLSREVQSLAGVTEYIDGYGDIVGSMQVYYFFTSLSNNVYSLYPCARLGQTSLLDTTWYLQQYTEPLSINFINGTPPSDTPSCGFYNENCAASKSNTFIIVMSVGCAVFVGLAIAAFFLYKRYRYERKLHSLSFLIDRNRIILKKHVNLMSTQSLRSMASIQGGSMIASQTLQNSHFLLDDYQQGETSNSFAGSNSRANSITGVFGGGSGSQTETTDDLRWHALSDFAVGLFEGRLVGLKRIYRSDIELTRNARLEIASLQESVNSNTIAFLGMVIQSPDVFIVYELAQRGSLKDIIDNEELPLDDIFMKQMTKDIVAGLEYLHSSPVGCHGRLKSTNCLIDTRWMVRLSSFGLRELRGDENPIREDVQEGKEELWTAPELLRWSTGLAQCSTLLVQKADVYSLSIVLYEIFGRCGPWGEEPMEPREIVNRVKHGNENEKKLFRPDMAVVKDAPNIVQDTIAAAWVEDPVDRPSLFQIKRKLRPLTAGLKRTIMDNMVSMIEKYTEKLEKDIAERNQELEKEKEKSEMLLKMMLPDVVAESLKRGSNVTAESFDSVTVFFSDCPGFVEMSATSQPIEIVQFLNDLYTCFDNIINQFDVYKVETIADAYMVVSGLPIPNGQHHCGEIASLGLAMLRAVETFKIRHRPNERVRLRIGMNSGPCVAGVVGLKMPRYCLFGDTVNTASRMESNGIPLRINCSESAYQILNHLGGYEIEERGLVEMKGKGKQMTYFVRSEDTNHRRERILKDRVKYSTLKNAKVEEKKIEFI